MLLQKKFVGSCVISWEEIVEKENEGAVQLYQRSGFHVLPYMEMKQ